MHIELRVSINEAYLILAGGPKIEEEDEPEPPEPFEWTEDWVKDLEYYDCQATTKGLDIVKILTL